MLTSFAKKFPVAVGLLFFSVGALSSLVKGAGLVTACYRGFIAGAVSAVFSALLGYIIFHEKISQPEVPEGLSHLSELFEQKKK